MVPTEVRLNTGSGEDGEGWRIGEGAPGSLDQHSVEKTVAH